MNSSVRTFYLPCCKQASFVVVSLIAFDRTYTLLLLAYSSFCNDEHITDHAVFVTNLPVLHHQLAVELRIKVHEKQT